MFDINPPAKLLFDLHVIYWNNNLEMFSCLTVRFNNVSYDILLLILLRLLLRLLLLLYYSYVIIANAIAIKMPDTVIGRINVTTTFYWILLRYCYYYDYGYC